MSWLCRAIDWLTAWWVKPAPPKRALPAPFDEACKIPMSPALTSDDDVERTGHYPVFCEKYADHQADDEYDAHWAPGVRWWTHPPGGGRKTLERIGPRWYPGTYRVHHDDAR